MSAAPRGLGRALAAHSTDELARALRALLMKPLLTAADADFPAVRNRAGVLRAWLLRETGWALHVERGWARLVKRPHDTGDGSRGAEGFGRSRYVLLCLAVAVLERADVQITLRTLGERLLELAADAELEATGFRFQLQQVHERRDLVQVCRFLLAQGVLERVAGDEEGFVQRTGDALYDIRRGVLAHLLACARGPSTYAAGEEPDCTATRLAALVQEFVPDTDEARRDASRHALTRRLLDDPVTCFDELEAPLRDYLANQRGPLAARLCRATGMSAEQRAEGVALVDADGELSDIHLPADGTIAHVTLLVAQHLLERSGDEPGRAVPESAVAAHVREAAEHYGRYWRKQAREVGAEHELADEALSRLAALKLVVREQGGVRVRPPLARYAPLQPVPEPRSGTLL